MAEEDLKFEKTAEDGTAGQLKMRQIRPGKDHAVVVNGQQVVLFDAPKKVSAKSEVVLPGFHLGVYDKVYLRVKDSRFSPVNLHRAYGDSEPIIFSIPDFNNFLAEGDAVWVELVSTNNPDASGYLSPYIKYTLKKEEDKGEGEGEEKAGEKQGAKGQSEEGGEPGKGLGFAGLAVAAAGEAMTGLVKPSFGSAGRQGGQAETAKDKLKQALKNGDRNALKSAIDEAKKNRDIESLKEVYKEASGAYEKSLFENALDLTDFQPRAVLEEESADVPEYEPSEEQEDIPSAVLSSPVVDIGTAAAGLGAVSSSTTTAAAGAGFVQGSQTGNFGTISQSSTAEGAVVRSGRVSGKQTVEVKRTAQASHGPSSVSQNVEFEASEPEAGGSTSVTTENRTEVSGGAQVQQSVSSRRTVSGSAGGGEIGGKTSVTSETETRQEREDSIKARVQGGGGSITASGSVEASTKAKLTETVQGGGAEAEMEASQETVDGVGRSQAQAPESVARQGSAAIPAQGGVRRVVVAGSTAGQAPAEGGETGIQGSMESRVSGSAQYEFSPPGQAPAAKLGVEILPGMPGVRIDASTLKTPFKGAVGKSEAAAKPAEQAPAGVQAPSEKKVGIGLKEDEAIEVQEGQKREKPSDEAEALAQISPQAREAALLFEAKASAQRKKMPGVAVPVSKKGGKAQDGEVEFKPGQNGRAAPRAGRAAGQPGQEREAPEGGGEENAENTEPQPKGKKPGGVVRDRVAAGAAEQARKSGMAGGMAVPGPLPATEAGKPQEGRPLTPAGGAVSGGEGEEPPQEENTASPEGEAPQDGQAVAGDQQQQNTLSQALSDRMDKLAEDKKLDAEIKQVTKEANLALDQVLMEGVAWVWGAAIPSFGLAVLLGAIIGDFLWAFKNSIIEGVLKPLLRTEALKKKGEEIAKQIKISTKVKLNILAMNLIVAAAIMILFLLFFMFLWVGCNYPPGITRLTYKLSVVGALGGSGICESIDNATSNFSFGGGNSGGAGASDSWGSPNGLLSTNQWTSQINQAAAQYSVDACILRVVVQKESTGQADIIGCDCAANGKPQLCLAGARGKYYPGYPFNWDQCSYGIGLTQWTIYPKSSSQNWNRWENQITPSRNLFNDKYYYVNDFLNPQTSLDLTARAFKNYLAQSGGSVAGAFRAYMGNGAPQSWVDQRMALYNMCKSSGGQ